jgi:hypothetical protein
MSGVRHVLKELHTDPKWSNTKVCRVLYPFVELVHLVPYFRTMQQARLVSLHDAFFYVFTIRMVGLASDQSNHYD